jgi:hypothetical protein
MNAQDDKRLALHAFVAGYINGCGSLGKHDAVGRQAEHAFKLWWARVHRNKGNGR